MQVTSLNKHILTSVRGLLTRWKNAHPCIERSGCAFTHLLSFISTGRAASRSSPRSDMPQRSRPAAPGSSDQTGPKSSQNVAVVLLPSNATACSLAKRCCSVQIVPGRPTLKRVRYQSIKPQDGRFNAIAFWRFALVPCTRPIPASDIPTRQLSCPEQQ